MKKFRLFEIHKVYPSEKKKGDTGVNTVAPKIGMRILWADGGTLPVSGVTEWVIRLAVTREQQRKGC